MLVAKGIDIKISNEMMIPMMITPMTTEKRIQKRRVPLFVIRDSVCSFYDVTMDQITEKTRKREVVYKRQVMQYMMERYNNSSLYTIADYTNVDNHATVLHSKKVITNLVDVYTKHRDEVVEIKNIMYRKLMSIVDKDTGFETISVDDIQLERRKGTIKK